MQSPHDCILLVKHLTNSSSLSQRPMTFLPASFAGRLEKPIAVLSRNLLEERAVREFLGSEFTDSDTKILLL